MGLWTVPAENPVANGTREIPVSAAGVDDAMTGDVLSFDGFTERDDPSVLLSF